VWSPAGFDADGGIRIVRPLAQEPDARLWITRPVREDRDTALRVHRPFASRGDTRQAVSVRLSRSAGAVLGVLHPGPGGRRATDRLRGADPGEPRDPDLKEEYACRLDSSSRPSRSLTARLLMGGPIEGITHCAIGEGDTPPSPIP